MLFLLLKRDKKKFFIDTHYFYDIIVECLFAKTFESKTHDSTTGGRLGSRCQALLLKRTRL